MLMFVDQGLIIKWRSGRRSQGRASARATALRPVLKPSRSHSYDLEEAICWVWNSSLTPLTPPYGTEVKKAWSCAPFPFMFSRFDA